MAQADNSIDFKHVILGRVPFLYLVLRQIN